MKQILLLLLLLPAAAFSQSIQSDQIDDFSNARRIATSRVEFKGFSNSLGGTLTIRERDTLLYMNLFFRAGKATYTDDQTKAVLKLANGETILVGNQGTYKELTATEPGFIVFGLNETDKAKLQQSKVVGYTIQTGRALVEMKLNEQQQQAFYKTIHLLESRARTIASVNDFSL
ncbi:MAG TPA: hypothetical protein VER36_08340 [Flavisolibacter sp.]|nr:hypothetical protein [Flavisolibacter sp.]